MKEEKEKKKEKRKNLGFALMLWPQNIPVVIQNKLIFQSQEMSTNGTGDEIKTINPK